MKTSNYPKIQTFGKKGDYEDIVHLIYENNEKIKKAEIKLNFFRSEIKKYSENDSEYSALKYDINTYLNNINYLNNELVRLHNLRTAIEQRILGRKIVG